MRRLTEADRQAWDAYRRTADPLHRDRRNRTASGPPGEPGPSRSEPAAPAPAARMPTFRVGERARAPTPSHDVAPTLRDGLRAAPVAMDARAFHRLRAGKLRPEAKLDLHGMTLEVAHPALIEFVLQARASGKRLLLVVTGKGKRREEAGPIPVRMGVLKHQVPQWLRLPPLGPLVLQVTEAHRSHGGAGAYYVYLRRG